MISTMWKTRTESQNLIIQMESTVDAEYRGICQNVGAIYKNLGFPYRYKHFFAAPKPMNRKKTLLLCFMLLLIYRCAATVLCSLCWRFDKAHPHRHPHYYVHLKTAFSNEKQLPSWKRISRHYWPHVALHQLHWYSFQFEYFLIELLKYFFIHNMIRHSFWVLWKDDICQT